MEEVISELSRFWGEQARWERDSDDHPHEARYLKLDCSKARTKLGWAPCWDLTTALRKTAEWYQVYRKRPLKIREKTLEQIREYMKKQRC